MRLQADGETVDLIGPKQARVLSSDGHTWYAVDLDGDGLCTCAGFGYRKACRHLDVVRRLRTGDAKVDVQGKLIDAPDPIELGRKLELWTSRYQNQDAIIASGCVPVRVTVGRPRFKLRYELGGFVPDAAPYGALFKINDRDEFTEAYTARLETVGIESIAASLAALGDKLVLLCYEDVTKDGEWCHRQVFADWWTIKIGTKVQELPPVAQR